MLLLCSEPYPAAFPVAHDAMAATARWLPRRHRCSILALALLGCCWHSAFTWRGKPQAQEEVAEYDEDLPARGGPLGWLHYDVILASRTTYPVALMVRSPQKPLKPSQIGFTCYGNVLLRRGHRVLDLLLCHLEAKRAETSRRLNCPTFDLPEMVSYVTCQFLYYMQSRDQCRKLSDGMRSVGPVCLEAVPVLDLWLAAGDGVLHLSRSLLLCLKRLVCPGAIFSDLMFVREAPQSGSVEL